MEVELCKSQKDRYSDEEAKVYSFVCRMLHSRYDRALYLAENEWEIDTEKAIYAPHDSVVTKAHMEEVSSGDWYVTEGLEFPIPVRKFIEIINVKELNINYKIALVFALMSKN